MITPRHLLPLLILALPLALAGETPPATPAPKTSVPNPFAARFKQVRERIDGLFRNRNEAPPAIDARTNPFRVPGTAAAPRPTGEAPPTPDASDNLALLQQSVATLKVSGLFEFGGRTNLVINGRPYKQGDTVQAHVRGETVYLRVQDISHRSVTLELNGAEMTLKY